MKFPMVSIFLLHAYSWAYAWLIPLIPGGTAS